MKDLTPSTRRLPASPCSWHLPAPGTRHGFVTEDLLDPDDVAGTLVGVLGVALEFPAVGLEYLAVRPPSPVVDRFGEAIRSNEERK